jgi:hypothetical protein
MTVGVRLLTPRQTEQLALARLLTGFHCNPACCCYRTDHVSNSCHNKRESALLHLHPSGWFSSAWSTVYGSAAHWITMSIRIADKINGRVPSAPQATIRRSDLTRRCLDVLEGRFLEWHGQKKTRHRLVLLVDDGSWVLITYFTINSATVVWASILVPHTSARAAAWGALQPCNTDPPSILAGKRSLSSLLRN